MSHRNCPTLVLKERLVQWLAPMQFVRLPLLPIDYVCHNACLQQLPSACARAPFQHLRMLVDLQTRDMAVIRWNRRALKVPEQGGAHPQLPSQRRGVPGHPRAHCCTGEC
jgi:hypothetical protein